MASIMTNKEKGMKFLMEFVGKEGLDMKAIYGELWLDNPVPFFMICTSHLKFDGGGMMVLMQLQYDDKFKRELCPVRHLGGEKSWMDML